MTKEVFVRVRSPRDLDLPKIVFFDQPKTVDYEGLKKMWQKRAVAVRLVIMKLLAPRPGRQQPFYNLTHSTIATCCSLFALVCSIAGCSQNLAAGSYFESELYHEQPLFQNFCYKGGRNKLIIKNYSQPVDSKVRTWRTRKDWNIEL